MQLLWQSRWSVVVGLSHPSRTKILFTNQPLSKQQRWVAVTLYYSTTTHDDDDEDDDNMNEWIDLFL
jgi:hypothetical protein